MQLTATGHDPLSPLKAEKASPLKAFLRHALPHQLITKQHNSRDRSLQTQFNKCF
jgi:hypothetical protein